MNIMEQKELHDTIDKLIIDSNGWSVIDKFFKENKAIQPIYEEVKNQCLRDQCYGVANIYALTIEKILEMLDLD